MKILLTTLNAKYIHSSLALYSLKTYASKYTNDITIKEFTINNDIDHVYSEIFKLNPDIIGFSCYIWNINETINIVSNLKKIMPNVKIILGGPEVSFDEQYYIDNYSVDYVISGEGEVSFYNLLISLDKNEIITNKILKPIKALDLDEIDFVYKYIEMKELENRIIYYESQRGCPFSCEYCLSSTTSGVTFLSLERVYSDLQFFLDAKVLQVKFVDRTFNASKKHALSIINFLIQNDNTVTNFHFEISADLFDDETIQALKYARPGLIQFEVGVQSINETTLSDISRSSNLNKLANNVIKINKLGNIHMHLDLICGLPNEDIESFKKSFNWVYKLKPEQLQLGFLKLLKGSKLRLKADDYNIKYKNYAPYEVLSTNSMSFDDILVLKGVEEKLEKYYNSTQFSLSINYVVNFFDSPYDFFVQIYNYFESKGLNNFNHKKLFYFYELFYFCTQICNNDELIILMNLLRVDILTNENTKNIDHILDNNNEKIKLSKNIYDDLISKGYTSSQISRNIIVETYDIDIIKYKKTGVINRLKQTLVFDYLTNEKVNIYIMEK